MIDYHVCVWEDLLIQDDEIEDFTNSLENDLLMGQFKLDGYFLERVITNPNIEKGEEGGRPDVIFIVFADREKDLLMREFLISRFTMGDFAFRLFDDIVGGGNEYIYPADIIYKYTYQTKEILIKKMEEHGLDLSIYGL